MGLRAGTFQERLAHLRGLSPADRFSALSALLESCSAAERAPVLVELLEVASHSGAPGTRRQWRQRARETADAALALIARRWEAIPDELRAAALSVGVGRWGDIAAAISQDADPSARRALARLCEDAADARLAGALVPLLSDAEHSVVAAAERALLALAFACARLDPQTGAEIGEPAEGVDTQARPLIEDAVTRAALAVGEHRRRGAMLAAMALLDPALLWRSRGSVGRSLADWFRSGDAASMSALKSAIRLSPHPLARQRALEWLAIPGLSGACAERLARGKTPEEHGVVLERASLLLNPARARRAMGIDAGRAPSRGTGGASRAQPSRDGPAPDRAALGTLATAARRALPRFVASLNTGIETRRALLEPLLGDTDPLARLASVRCTTGAGQLDLCFDPEPAIARTAFLAWSLLGERGPGAVFESRLGLHDDPSRRRSLSLLSRSPHAAVRALAVQERASLEVLDPSSPASRVRARWLHARDPVAFEALLREAMTSPDQERRLRAVRLVRHLGLCARFEADLLGVVESAAEGAGRAVATAVAALGDLQSPASVAVIHDRLADPDVRVRANAVEALARQSRGGTDLAVADPAVHGLLIELKDDANHRVRANAVRALLTRPAAALEPKPGDGASRVYEPAAVGALAEMLADPRPEHRLAASWLAGRLMPLRGRARLGKRFAELASRIGEVASGDSDASVRRRAGQCVRVLQSELRIVWAARAKKREQNSAGAAA